MKAKINKEGRLEIERAGKFKRQRCPHQEIDAQTLMRLCGDWCQMFREPEIYHNFMQTPKDGISIRIC